MLAEIIDQFLTSLINLRSPHTITWYRKRLQPLRALPQNISSITLLDLQAIYAGLAGRTLKYASPTATRPPQPGALSPSTLRGYVRAWRAFFTWCVEGQLLAVSPARKLKLPRLPEQPPKAISRADMERLVTAARFSSARDYAIACLLADSACRVGGLCALTLENLDLDRRVAFVLEKGQLRFLLFGARTVDALQAYLAVRPAVPYRALFIGRRGVPLQPGGVHALLDRLATQAGVRGRHNPHAWRHGWARAALQDGAELSAVGQFLGHRQVQTTYEFYGRWDLTDLEQLRAAHSWLPSAPLDSPHDTV